MVEPSTSPDPASLPQVPEPGLAPRALGLSLMALVGVGLALGLSAMAFSPAAVWIVLGFTGLLDVGAVAAAGLALTRQPTPADRTRALAALGVAVVTGLAALYLAS